jgi:hypothetical protein
VKVQQREPHLLDIVAALQAAGGIAGGVNRRKQKCDQNPNDHDNDKQLDECESAPQSRRDRAWPDGHDSSPKKILSSGVADSRAAIAGAGSAAAIGRCEMGLDRP